MKANALTLYVVKEFLKNEHGDHASILDLVDDMVHETGLLKLSTDECDIRWGDEHVVMLDDFLSAYTGKVIEKCINVIESFKDEELNDHFDPILIDDAKTCPFAEGVEGLPYEERDYPAVYDDGTCQGYGTAEEGPLGAINEPPYPCIECPHNEWWDE